MARFLPCLVAVTFAIGLPLAAFGAMTTALQVSGNVGYELAGIASPGPPVNANVTLSTLPPGAFPMFAFLYTNDFVGIGTGGGWIDVTLTPPGGPATGIAGNTAPTSSDPVPLAQTFGYEIPFNPGLVTGNGSYGVTITPSFIGGNANQMAGAGILVIYSHPLLPQSTITVNHGVFMMGTGGNPNSQTTTFQQLGSPIHGTSNATLSLLTFADDAFTSGEDIYFNGVDIGGPIDANLPGGGSASIFNFNVATYSGGVNTSTLTSTGDIFGWHVAVLQTPVPEPSSWLLAALGVSGLAWLRWRRRQ